MTFLNWKLPGVFYGWWIVGACFLVASLTGGFIVLGFTAFFEPIAYEFGWSYAQISLAASLRGAEVGLLAPLVGFIIDRWGPRRIMFTGIIIIGLGLLFLSRITSLSTFYGAFALIAIGISGCSATVTMTAVANWFRKKVGIAMGIMLSGFASGGLWMPLVVELIDIFGWRPAIFILGLIIWAIGLPLSLLLRHKPEQYGCLADGEQSDAMAPDNSLYPAQTIEVNITTKQAIKSRAFWHIVLAMMLQFFAISSVIVHVMPYLSSVGIARSTSTFVASAVPLLSITGRLGAGWLGDRFDKRWVATGCFTIMGLGLLAFSYLSYEAIALIFPFAIFFGIGWGGNTTLRAALLREYFGRSRFGSILGLTMGMLALGTIIGPLFAGWVFDNRNSYHAAWLTFACFVVIALIIMMTTPSVSNHIQSIKKQS